MSPAGSANTETGGTLSRFTYGLDAAGNRIEQTTSVGTTYYGYDPLDRLTGACTGGSCVPAGAAPLPCLACVAGTISRPAASVTPNPSDLTTTYTYDPVGNRLTAVNYGGTTTYVYDVADRLTSLTPPGGPAVPYTYDANGNELTAGSATYAYDLAGRMHSATVGATTTTYGWSGDGIRLSASTGAGAATTNFLVDRAFGLPQVALERDGTGTIVSRSAYGLSRLALTAPTFGTLYEHPDPLGSVTDLTSGTGASLAWSEFAPFGSLERARGAGAEA
jgi:YD repeat-containing protein